MSYHDVEFVLDLDIANHAVYHVPVIAEIEFIEEEKDIGIKEGVLLLGLKNMKNKPLNMIYKNLSNDQISYIEDTIYHRYMCE